MKINITKYREKIDFLWSCVLYWSQSVFFRSREISQKDLNFITFISALKIQETYQFNL